jgi:hypothetical protein
MFAKIAKQFFLGSLCLFMFAKIASQFFLGSLCLFQFAASRRG